MKRIYCNKLDVWKYAVTGHRFFNKTMSRIITFVIVTSCVVLPAFGALSRAGLRQIVTSRRKNSMQYILSGRLL